MKIDAVEFHYLAMPEIRDVGDGSQDALLVRVRSGALSGWGECEAAPLASIAAWCCPMSHAACKPVSASVLGQTIDRPDDVVRVNRLVRANSPDLLQADHTLSGVDIALWDLLGKARSEPTYRLLGYRSAPGKIAYASVLFGDEPQETLRRGRAAREAGFRAAKFGWGPYGHSTVAADADQVRAAREGIGPDGILLVDAGTVWIDDVEAAAARLPALIDARAVWLEEPFVNGALSAYRELARRSGPVKIAGGEGCHTFHQAQAMIDAAGLGFVQIDAGRIGGITTAKEVADYAHARQVRFVNHTFTTQLALSASLQPYAGRAGDDLCEYPFLPSPLARDFTRGKLAPDAEGRIAPPGAPGLGLEPDLAALRPYALDVELRVAGRTLFRSVPLVD